MQKLTEQNKIDIKTLFENISNREDIISILNFIRECQFGEDFNQIRKKAYTYYSNPKISKKRYHKFEISKKSGGVRQIHAPINGLKSIQKTLNTLLQCIFIPHESVTGFVSDRSIIDNAKAHVGKHYVYNIDLKDFFPSVDMRRVKACLKNPPFNINDQLAFELANLCCEKLEVERLIKGDFVKKELFVLPQGAPTSPTITNIICQRLDRKMAGLAKRKGLTYSRYADDITFSSDYNAYQNGGEFQIELHKIIEEENFRINPEKTRLQKTGYRKEVTGLSVNKKVNVSRRYIKHIRMCLYFWERYGFEKANNIFQRKYLLDKEHITNKEADMSRVIEGKLLFLSMVKGKDDSAYIKLHTRFNNLVKDKKEKDIKKVDIIRVVQEICEKGVKKGILLYEKYKNQ